MRTLQLQGDVLSLVPLRGLLLTALPPLSSSPQPLLLAGTHTGTVNALAMDRGVSLGSWAAHDDAVSCLAGLPGLEAGSQAALATSSWDCSLKVWACAEGRGPWAQPLGAAAAAAGSGGSTAQPVRQYSDFESGVWCVAANAAGQLLVAGTEEGWLSGWDLRCAPEAGPAWRQQLSQDYLGGVALTPDGRHALVAAADGAMHLLDLRHAAAGPLSTGRCRQPLRCCSALDGELAVAGDEGGALQLWDIGQLTGARTAPVGRLPPSPDGLYQPFPVAAGEQACSAAITGLAALHDPSGPAGNQSLLAACCDDGTLHVVGSL